MPELNNDTSDAAAPETATVWPQLAVPGHGLENEVADPAVRTILERVRDVPGLPVSEHQAAYAGMHDALLEALNQEPQHGQPQHGQPQHGQALPGPGAA